MKSHWLLIILVFVSTTSIAQKKGKFIYLDKNGVTVKATELAEVGKSYEVNGKDYLVVDRKILDSLIALDYDLSSVVTSKVITMRNLFGSVSDVMVNE